MFTKRAHRELGQAMVLLVLAMVGILGFAAVALDGSNIYTEQRRAQAAADSAALAAAYQQMKGTSDASILSQAALANAAQNGYANTTASGLVSFYRPPVDGPYLGQSQYLQVIITKTVQTSLAHLVNRGPVQLTARAVAHGSASGSLMAGYAIGAMDPNPCNGNDFTGHGGVESVVENGGIFVNANCSGTP